MSYELGLFQVLNFFIEFPFLQGRALVVAGQYSKLLPTDAAGQYLDAALQVLESAEAGIPFKISAVKALKQYVYTPYTPGYLLIPLQVLQRY